MTVSVFDLFTVGIGPSSSHTVGPMRAAKTFVKELQRQDSLADVDGVQVDLFGSLAATGPGHGTIPAIILGLAGYRPETLDPDIKDDQIDQIRRSGHLTLGGQKCIAFAEENVRLRPLTVLEYHSNGMTFSATSEDKRLLHERTYFSVGGGFVTTGRTDLNQPAVAHSDSPFSFISGQELLEISERHQLPVSAVMLKFETSLRTEPQVTQRLLHIRDVMVQCQYRGLEREGVLPGPLRVRRRARSWHEKLRAEDPRRDPAYAEDWVNLVALAINEENAAGGRIVTAPTNGAAGIIPAVLHYAVTYTPAGNRDPDNTAVQFLLTAGAIGSLYKERASISGAEVGCQGEVGAAASMAAAGLTDIMGGTPRQVENAAEIAMEHSLGLTCDPIGGLVQIPCIERNAISAGKAINAARMALRGDGTHHVSLDQVIETLRTTGADMDTKYKETSTGGLAINVPVNLIEC